jgi:(p)ppGpp synthase/HD superfamily hydrolase
MYTATELNLIERARVFATAAHAAVGQLRKYTNEPYIVHPTEVAAIVSSVEHTPEMVAAAFLHDVLEDTKVTTAELRSEFGDEVTALVLWLTSLDVEGNRAYRKALDCEFLAAAPAEAQTVKLADLISNTSTIVQFDEKFAKVYLKEKLDLLAVLTKGNEDLRYRAYELCWKGL